MWDPLLPDFAYSQPFIRAGFCSPPYYCMSLRMGQETPVPILFLW